jgi:hypothetical protein
MGEVWALVSSRTIPIRFCFSILTVMSMWIDCNMLLGVAVHFSY